MTEGGERYIYIYSNYPGSSRGRRTMTRRQTRWYRCLAHRPSPPSVRRTLVFFCDLQLFLSNYRGELDGRGKLIMPQSGRAVAQNKNARLRATPLGQIKSARSAEPFESFLRHHRRHYVFLPFFSSFFSFSMSAGSRRTELEYTYILKDEIFGRARNGFESIEGKCRVREPLRVIGSLERDCWIPRRVPGQTYIKYKAFP